MSTPKLSTRQGHARFLPGGYAAAQLVRQNQEALSSAFEIQRANAEPLEIYAAKSGEEQPQSRL